MIADNAVTADAPSTAFNLMDVASIRQVLRGYPDACVDLIDLTGAVKNLAARPKELVRVTLQSFSCFEPANGLARTSSSRC